MIWTEIKDQIKKRLGIWMTVARNHCVVKEEWMTYPMERINHHILLIERRIEACIEDNRGNCFNF